MENVPDDVALAVDLESWLVGVLGVGESDGGRRIERDRRREVDVRLVGRLLKAGVEAREVGRGGRLSRRRGGDVGGHRGRV